MALDASPKNKNFNPNFIPNSPLSKFKTVPDFEPNQFSTLNKGALMTLSSPQFHPDFTFTLELTFQACSALTWTMAIFCQTPQRWLSPTRDHFSLT